MFIECKLTMTLKESAWLLQLYYTIAMAKRAASLTVFLKRSFVGNGTNHICPLDVGIFLE